MNKIEAIQELLDSINIEDLTMFSSVGCYSITCSNCIIGKIALSKSYKNCRRYLSAIDTIPSVIEGKDDVCMTTLSWLFFQKNGKYKMFWRV
ncbi:MAG: hypothetical protein ACRC0F_00120 [Cetobacterium sp.]